MLSPENLIPLYTIKYPLWPLRMAYIQSYQKPSTRYHAPLCVHYGSFWGSRGALPRLCEGYLPHAPASALVGRPAWWKTMAFCQDDGPFPYSLPVSLTGNF